MGRHLCCAACQELCHTKQTGWQPGDSCRDNAAHPWLRRGAHRLRASRCRAAHRRELRRGRRACLRGGAGRSGAPSRRPTHCGLLWGAWPHARRGPLACGQTPRRHSCHRLPRMRGQGLSTPGSQGPRGPLGHGTPRAWDPSGRHRGCLRLLLSMCGGRGRGCGLRLRRLLRRSCCGCCLRSRLRKRLQAYLDTPNSCPGCPEFARSAWPSCM